ncbi:MAG: putative peptide zinc metalloprotease protein, partial [Thermodesulfobacteriota bacterium]|nr:putative peptide zinc metalloprotease protein [Thermodesulfobacteriota bacterium]
AQIKLRENIKKARNTQRFSSVFFLFIPLVNPDNFLEKTIPYVKRIWNRWTVSLVLFAFVGAIFLFIDGFSRIETEYLFFFNLENLIYLWITIAVTKFVHEFAHAYTAKNYGLHVPQMGVGFLIFFPCLFCNTTDAWRIADRKPRVAIAAAGIVAELVLAIFATYVWYFTKPGMINSLAFYLMTVSSVSTVLFNGCPLIRFDGYFILSDVLRIPNLMVKSRGYIKYLVMNQAMGISDIPNTATTRRERTIFLIHGLGTYFYRFFLYTGIVIGVYYRFDKSVGIILAVLAFALFIVRPVLKGIKDLYVKRALIKPRPVGSTVLLGVLACVAIILFVPLSWNSSYPCFAAPMWSQKLTIPLYTAVESAFVQEGAKVRQGEPLLVLDVNQLGLNILKKENEHRILEEEIQLYQLDENNRARVGEKRADLERLDHELRILRRDLRLARQGIVAPFDGVVTKLDYRVQQGFQPGEGYIVGELQSTSQLVVYALIPEDDVRRLHPADKVKVWFPLGAGIVLDERIDSLRRYGEKNLRDSPFSSRFGGEVATEIRGEKQKDVPLEARYICIVNVLDNENNVPLGITGKLFVPMVPKSIAARWLEAAVKTFNMEMLF